MSTVYPLLTVSFMFAWAHLPLPPFDKPRRWPPPPIAAERIYRPSYPAMEEGSTKASLIWRFMAVFALHALAIFVFTRGFLLTRTELSAFSSCSDASAAPCASSSPGGSGGDGSQCWTKPAVDKVVIIIFDALR